MKRLLLQAAAYAIFLSAGCVLAERLVSILCESATLKLKKENARQVNNNEIFLKYEKNFSCY